MKRLIIALLVGGMIFGVVFGAAATLNVTANPLQSGGDTDLTCDDAIQIHWNIQWSNSEGDYVVHNVNVGGVNEAFNDSTVVVTLTASNGNFLAQRTTTKTASTNPQVNFGVGDDSPVKVSDVFDVHVALIN